MKPKMLPLKNVKSALGARMLSEGPAEESVTDVALGKLTTVLAMRA
jgi:hypothetical protein